MAAAQNPSGTGQAPPEFRGMWVTRFEWPDPDPAKAKAYIDGVMSDLAKHHFNAVLFQVRGQADTFYPSEEEPWSPMITSSPAGPGWDPLQYAIEKAHAHGLQFHAYINTHVCWQDPQDRPPPMANHLFYHHCNAADPDRRDWLIHDEQGRPVQFESDHYVWIAPGVPAAQAYIRRQVMHVVTRYDVDGVHFDRIRMPAPHYSHDPISTARRQPGSEGNPAGLDFADWTRDQFTRLLCDLYAQINEVKPHITISAAPVGLYKQDRYPNYPASFLFGWSKGYQDAQAWMRAGALDLVMPQIYWADGPPPPDFNEILSDWLAHAAGRHVAAGLNRSLALDELVRQVRFARESGGQGTVMFHYGGFAGAGGFKKYKQRGGVFELPAPVPPMPWKESPTEGILIGTLADAATGESVVDAQITRPGNEQVALSSGDGLWSMLKVPPGTHALVIRKAGYSEQRFESVAIEAGRVTRIDVALHPQTEAVSRSTSTPSTASAAEGGEPSAPTPATAPPAAEQPGKSDHTGRRVAVALAGVLLLLSVGFGLWYRRRRRA
ncbi:MAG TPA: family 10 glycosylhydrolase [Phycisphaerae bacterium]|nr:family 10 glycosylhydrolase [Phycisphaerae bacterium]